ncbi:hypothetical protein [Colwellia psychrerythraea]|uniref:Uncharacterized protein n=1 Tax=Colwellia psychrerythraea TaxID=28229 RepID=A0A099KBE8_COLPS|nr:hypothetical protein [Colwellia psychrerythraea]KGJ87636.1 hypothetical protein ND2E_4374 [Colwellia psychrerythraea]
MKETNTKSNSLSLELLERIRDDYTVFMSVENYQNLPPSEIKKALAVNGLVIRCLTNPPSNYREIAIYQNPMSIKYIKDLTDEEIKQSIKAEPLAIRHIKAPNKETTLLAVSLFTNAIDSIKDPSEEVKLLTIIKSNNHEELTNESDMGLLALTYRFLCKNKLIFCSALAKSNDFKSLEEIIIIKEKIRRQIIHKHPALEAYI